jgi:uncharacterized protein YbjT (DUF2867 family)
MSVSPVVSVLLVGATGPLGSALAGGFLHPDYRSRVQLYVMTRKATATTEGPKKEQLDALVKQGAQIRYGDISESSELELAEQLKGINVIVSAVGAMGKEDTITPQLRLLAAAKAAGVRWFIPSEFGFDAEEFETYADANEIIPFLPQKMVVAKAVRSSGLDYTFIYPGLFMEYAFSPFVGVDLEKQVITAPGAFNVKVTTTTLADIGRLTADAIVSGRGRNQIIHFGSSTLSLEELAKELESATGKKLARAVREVRDMDRAIAANSGDWQARWSKAFVKLPRAVHWDLRKSYSTQWKIPVSTATEYAKKTFGNK